MRFVSLVARHGSGKMTFVSGAIYEGQWQYDKMSGYGTLKFPDGAIQEGTWKEGLLDGCVLFTWPHGVTEYREYESGGGWCACTFWSSTAKMVCCGCSVMFQPCTQ